MPKNILSTTRIKSLFEIVFFEIINASKIGTPAAFKDERIREKFANDAFVINALVIGRESKILSLNKRKFSDLEILLKVKYEIGSNGIDHIMKEISLIELEQSTSNCVKKGSSTPLDP